MGNKQQKPKQEEDLDDDQIDELIRNTPVEIPLQPAVKTSPPPPPPKPVTPTQATTTTSYPWKRNPAFEQFLLDHMPVSDATEIQRKSLWEWEHLCKQNGIIIPDIIAKTLMSDEEEGGAANEGKTKVSPTTNPSPSPPPLASQAPPRTPQLPAPTRTYPSSPPIQQQQQRNYDAPPIQQQQQPFPVFIQGNRPKSMTLDEGRRPLDDGRKMMPVPRLPPPPPPPPASQYTNTMPDAGAKSLTRYKDSVETVMEYERQLARKSDLQERIESGSLPNNWTKSDVDAWTEMRERTRSQHATLQAHYFRHIQNMQLDLQQRQNWMRDCHYALDNEIVSHHQKRCALLQADIDRLSKAVNGTSENGMSDRMGF